MSVPDAVRERQSLCDDALAAGPDASTLCEGWTVRDLLVHLVRRDGGRRRDLAGLPFDALVKRFRSGPPAFSPARWAPIDALMNGAEFYVHHEDVRRAQPGWEPRDVPRAQSDALWRMLKLTGRFAYRKAGVGVVVVTPEGPRTVLRSAPTAVTLTGPVQELVLHSFGRRSRARVEVGGVPSAVAAFERAYP
ncbi:MAG: maleylpyruvate isomerase family mycothiol-dependent enzyme [Janthinobacterium lividum]